MYHSNDLTVVIPTYNRSKYLRRSLDYWGLSSVSVIVADGSDERYDGFIPLNITYCHSNQLSLTERWNDALQKVNTSYVALCADDDFLSLSGLDACLDYLNNRSDYASAQGLEVLFEIDHNQDISVELSNSKMVAHHIDCNAASERLGQLFTEYIHQIYSVYRTPFLQIAFQACIGQTNPNYLELAAAIVPTIFGKHKVLPLFYSAREHIPASSSGSFEVPRFDVLTPQGSISYKHWKANIARIYSDVEGLSFKESQQIIDKILANYFDWDLRTFPHRMPKGANFWSFPISLLMKETLKRITPEPLLRAKRGFYKKLRTRNLPSYPFTDPAAELEWLKLVDFISNHEISQ